MDVIRAATLHANLTLGVVQVVQVQLGDKGAQLEQQREGLTNITGSAKHGDLVLALGDLERLREGSECAPGPRSGGHGRRPGWQRHTCG